MRSARAALKTAVTACLVRILVAGDYHTNAGQYVTDEPGQVDDSAQAVIAVVVEGDVRATEPAVARTHRLTTLAVVVKVPVKLGAAQDALDLVLADIEAAMADQQFRYPVGVTFPQYQSMTPITPEAGMAWIGAVLRYTSHTAIKPLPDATP